MELSSTSRLTSVEIEPKQESRIQSNTSSIRPLNADDIHLKAVQPGASYVQANKSCDIKLAEQANDDTCLSKEDPPKNSSSRSDSIIDDPGRHKRRRCVRVEAIDDKIPVTSTEKELLNARILKLFRRIFHKGESEEIQHESPEDLESGSDVQANDDIDVGETFTEVSIPQTYDAINKKCSADIAADITGKFFIMETNLPHLSLCNDVFETYQPSLTIPNKPTKDPLEFFNKIRAEVLSNSRLPSEVDKNQEGGSSNIMKITRCQTKYSAFVCSCMKPKSFDENSIMSLESRKFVQLKPSKNKYKVYLKKEENPSSQRRSRSKSADMSARLGE